MHLAMIQPFIQSHCRSRPEKPAKDITCLRTTLNLGDIPDWRATALHTDPDLQERAPALLRRTLAPYGIRFADASAE